jgi:hypothetical protein
VSDRLVSLHGPVMPSSQEVTRPASADRVRHSAGPRSRVVREREQNHDHDRERGSGANGQRATEHIGVAANVFHVAMSGELLAVAMASEQIAAGADEFHVAMSGELLAAAMARSEQLVPRAVDEFLAAMSGELLCFFAIFENRMGQQCNAAL